MDKKEIYLVDDSADYRLLVRGIFSKYLPDYHVKFFQGANELYQFLILQSSPDYAGRVPALIIMDLDMPTIDGLTLLKLLRNTPDNASTQWKTLPVVILSNSNAPDVISKCYQAGTNSYFVKPMDFEELRLMLETICRYWLGYNRLPQLNPAKAEDKSAAVDFRD